MNSQGQRPWEPRPSLETDPEGVVQRAPRRRTPSGSNFVLGSVPGALPPAAMFIPFGELTAAPLTEQYWALAPEARRWPSAAEAAPLHIAVGAVKTARPYTG